ncbi:MAG: hexokinase [Spirochaetaceae bacterium]|jgi:hexokinase|nr:hexokinase [Spirochaetaceae bacterium]
MFNPAELDDFARYYGFHYDICDSRILIRDLLTEMDRGLRGLTSDLAMIPAYLGLTTRLEPGRRVLALDAGGTNLRAALVRFTGDGKAETEGSFRSFMPGTRGRVSAEEFFDLLAAAAAPLLESAGDIAGIGFCFSYPMEVTADSDGILLKFAKEVDAPEVVGRRMGAGLREALTRRGFKAPERIVLLNDTASTLLSGLLQIPAQTGGADLYGVEAGPVIGLILGTGFNTAYPEKNIPKIGFESENDPQIVVCESGGFNPRFLGALDRQFDAATKNPGGYTLEKSAAGAYLGPLTLLVLKQAVKDGVLKFGASEKLLAWDTLQTRELNEFMYAPLAGEGPVGSLFGPGERDALATFCYLSSIITKRGALLTSAVAAATVEHLGAGRDPLVPVRIAVEGTTYLRYRGMREAFEASLHIMLNREGPRYYTVAPVEQASLLGAAVAAG